MKLEGKWYISVYDDNQTSTYPGVTEVEILDHGHWVRFIAADGALHVTSFPVHLRTKVKPGQKSEGE